MSRQTSPSGHQQPLPPPSTANLPASTSASPAPALGAAPAQYETVFTNHKAGMDNADLNKVKNVVYEMSKDSVHFQNEQRKMQQTEEKIARMKSTAASLSSSELAAKAAAMDARIAELEATRDLTRTWIHVDMDAFFAAVEELSNPSLKGKAFAVGGIGMISTANYAARAYGVRSAMPGFIALKLCPELIFVPTNFEKYRQASEITRKVFAEYDPHFQSASLDEAALDVTDVCAAQGGVSGAEIAAQIREKVELATGGLTCSCGVAPNRTLAKICSDKNKPNGQYVLGSSKPAVEAFVQDLPVRKVPGVGRVTEHVLRAFGIEKCGDIMPHRGLLASLFSPISMEFFLHCALGLGSTQHGESIAQGEIGRKGISTERTFRPLSNRNDLEAKCKELAENLASDMAEENLKGKTLTLKLKLTTFEVRTRAVTLPRYVHTAEDILAAGLKLLRAELPVEIRLMGLRMSHFYEEMKRAPDQPSLQDVFSRREKNKQKQENTNRSEKDGREDGGGDNIDADDDDGMALVHTSQVLSAGDEVELTLRDWQDPLSSPTAGGHDGAGGGGSASGALTTTSRSLHIPSTTLDDIARGSNTTVSTNKVNNNPIKLLAKPAVEQTWVCTACTFENPKRQLLCEMCGCSKTGTRPGDDSSISNKNTGGGGMAGGGQRRGKKRSQTTATPAAAAGGASILNFCVSQKTQKKE
jgi:DNA polymerase kappa